MSERLQKLTAILALDPADPFVLYGIAQEHAKVGEHAIAIGYYERCLAADPTYCYGYYHMAKSLASADRLAEANAVVADGVRMALKMGDGKASGELSTLQIELGEASR